MRRKRRRKKRIIISLILLIPILLFVIYNQKENNNTKTIKPYEAKKIDIVYDKLKKYSINKDFVKWVDDNYNNSIEKLDILLKEKEYTQNIWHEATGNSFLVLNDIYNKKYEERDNVQIINSNNPSKISIVGDVSLADNWYIMPEYDSRGKGIYGILSEETVDLMNKSDLMIVNSEFTVSSRGEAMKGKQYTFRANPTRLSIYNEMGVDLVTLANNHVYDFGKDAFLDMLDEYDKIKMPRIGAGHNLEEAMKPYYFIINGYKVAFLNGTRAEKYILTPGATETDEGVFRCYDPTNMINQIKNIRQQSDYIIVIMHYGKEGYHELEKEQIESSKQYIEAGADVIVGHHAHTLQGIEIYNDKPIIYNLGNFIFSEETLDTAIFQIVLNEDGKMEYYIIPAIQHNEYTELLKGNDKQRVINNLNTWSINAKIDSEGKIDK